MKQTIRKHLSVLLALVMVLTLLPTVTVTARADGPISLGNVAINNTTPTNTTPTNTTPTDTTPTDVPATSDLETPLTLEAITDGTILVKNPKSGMQYSLNGGTKTDVTTAINVSMGDKVAFYGTADSYSGTAISGGSAQCYIYGNIMSLINATGFATATALTKEDAFINLFNGNACLLSHESRKLVLPATTLADFCYSYMFAGCTGLTTAPELPATTLANRCYANMFYGCESLTTAPELPATTLADACYMGMFSGCAVLTTAPALPATTLAESCYDGMFSGCAKLTTAPALPATTLADGCYASMFSGCASLTTAPELPATTLTYGCYAGMFADCTSLTTAPALPATALAYGCYMSMFYRCENLTTAPALPATTLADFCYMSMFSSCKNLNAVTCLAEDIPVDYATMSWLYGVASTGTFTKAPGMENWATNSDSGIPEGWTVKDYTAPVTYLDAQVDDTTHAVTYTPATCTDYTPVASDTDVWSGGWYVVKENVTIANGVTFSGDVRLILCDGATLTVNIADQNGNAIKSSGSGSLTVYAQSTGDNAGELKATAQGGSAILTDGCAVTVNGGKVTATMGSDNGYEQHAGIEVLNGSLTINGGVVNASVKGYNKGISADKAPVTINGGAVTVQGNQGGIWFLNTNMTVNGGSLVANSGQFYGIGSFYASLAITGGTVTAESGSSGISADTVSISGGDLTIKNGISGKNVSISGGNVKAGGYYAIYGNETVTISGGAVEATGRAYGVYTWNGDVTFTGGNVIASATDAGDASAVNVHSENSAVVIGPGLRVDAGDNESAAVKVTKTFPETHPQKWAHIYEITNSTYTLTIPSAVTVSGAGWNATGGVGASGELVKGKKLTVTAASGDAFALVCAGKGQIGYYLAATATDTQPTTAWTFTALDDDPATLPMGVIVSETDYNSARPGTYTDTVTFTAQVEEASTLQKMTIVADLSNFETTADVDFYYMAGETWKQAIENHPTENTGWSTFDNSFNEFIVKGEQYTDETRNIYNFYLLDATYDLVNFDLVIDPTGSYTLVEPA